MISELTIDLLVYLRAASKYDKQAQELFDRVWDKVIKLEINN